MSKWPQAEIEKIAGSDDLHVAPFREDGKTPGTLTWIWSVVVDGELYVRAYNGTASRWYQAVLTQKAGQIKSAGMMKDVTFAAASGELQDAIDAAYRAKYTSSPYLRPMIGDKARAATMHIIPRA